MSERTSTLLEVVNRVREMNESSVILQGSPNQSPPSTSSRLGFSSSAFVPGIKREHSNSEMNFVSPTPPPPPPSSSTNNGGEDMVSDDEQQPLDFSSKKIKRERIGCSPEYGVLGSDGHSDNSSNASGSSPHVSPAHHSTTPSNLGSLTPTLLPLPTHSSTPIPTAATLNLLSVLQQQQQQQQQIPANTPPYNPLLLAAAAAGNFSQSVVPQPTPAPPVSNIQANLAELSKVSNESQESYQKFRESMLQKIEMSRPKGRRSSSINGYSPCNSSSNQRETSPHNHNQVQHGALKDDAYWERRKKNNEAAKRSRDARRNKENEVAVRAQFLEQENIQLKIELAQLRSEILNLRDEVYKNNGALESMQSS